jgi:PEP-CTERM motif
MRFHPEDRGPIAVRLLVAASVCVWVAGLPTPARAATIHLFDWGFNLDGTTYCGLGPCDSDGISPPGGLPGAIDAGLFDFETGLGTIQVSASGAGSHYLSLFVDHEIDVVENTPFNELGVASGTPAAGQSWEIDEPGYVFGDIFFNFVDGTLDGANGVAGPPFDDVSMALASSFVLAPGESATVSFLLSQTAPLSGFYLVHFDPESEAAIYFSSNLSVSEAPRVPEPGTLLLLVAGLALTATGRRRRQ